MNGLNIQEAVRWLLYARQDLATAEKMVNKSDYYYFASMLSAGSVFWNRRIMSIEAGSSLANRRT